MDFPLPAALVGIVLLLVLAGFAVSISVLRERVDKLEAQLKQQIQSRQGRVRNISERSTATPPIDARGRTVRRDSNDLEATGRVTRVKLRTKRVGGEPDVSDSDDR